MQLYAPTSGLLGSLRDMVASGSSQLEDRAVACLNHLVADALTLAPSCLRYMAALTNRSDVFRFCAIPQVRREYRQRALLGQLTASCRRQVMAIATLAKVVHNRDVFTGVVKIRKGQALKLLVENGDMEVRACAVCLRCADMSLLSPIAPPRCVVCAQNVRRIHSDDRGSDPHPPHCRPCNCCRSRSRN